MVRTRSLVIGWPVVITALGLGLVPPTVRGDDVARVGVPADVSAGTSDGDSATREPVPLERRPYRIRAWVAVDRDARLDKVGRDQLVDAWLDLVRRFVGAPWDLDVAADPGPLLVTSPEQVTSNELATFAGGFDTLWVIRVGSDGRGGFHYLGRSYDVRTRVLGAIHRMIAPHPQDMARPLLRLSRQLFTPYAEIGTESDGGVRIRLQAGALTPHSPAGAVAARGTIFVPVRIFLNADGSIRQASPIPWSYLRVEEHDAAGARCSLLSSVRNPLSRRIMGRHQLVAVGIRPGSEATRFRFETLPPDSRPAAGYTLTWRVDPTGPPRVVGTTDRDGRIALPPGLAVDLVTLRLLAGGVEPLVEFPVVPGETTDERVIRVNPMSEAVALEARLDALRDEVVDEVASRARLEAMLASRIEGSAWDEAKALIDEYRKLAPSKTYLDRLESIRVQAKQQQDESKVAILTRTAQARLDETESLILRYLAGDAMEGFEAAYREAVGLVESPPAAGWTAFTPPGGGFSVLLPGRPALVETPVVPLDIETSFTQYLLDAGNGVSYAVAFTTAPALSTVESPDRVQQSLQDAIESARAANPGSAISGERTVTLDDIKGIEYLLEPRSTTGPAAVFRRVRQYRTSQGRSFILAVSGTQNQVRSRLAEAFFNSFRILGPSVAVSQPAPETPPEPDARPVRTPPNATAF